MEVPRLLQQVPRDPQADRGGHEDQVEPAEQVRDLSYILINNDLIYLQVRQHLRGGRDQGAAELRVRLVQTSIRMLHQI